MPPVKLSDLSTIDELKSSLRKHAEGKLCVVMFTTSGTWCRPCLDSKKRIYDERSKKGLCIDHEPNTVFFYVSIEDNKELAEDFKITTIPHFYLMKCTSNGNVEPKCNFRGGSELEKKVREFC